MIEGLTAVKRYLDSKVDSLDPSIIDNVCLIDGPSYKALADRIDRLANDLELVGRPSFAIRQEAGRLTSHALDLWHRLDDLATGTNPKDFPVASPVSESDSYRSQAIRALQQLADSLEQRQQRWWRSELYHPKRRCELQALRIGERTLLSVAEVLENVELGETTGNDLELVRRAAQHLRALVSPPHPDREGQQSGDNGEDGVRDQPRLTRREAEVWNALRGRFATGATLASELDIGEDQVRTLKKTICGKSGYHIAHQPGRGYYRPDALPPEPTT